MNSGAHSSQLLSELPGPDSLLVARKIWQQVHKVIREIEPAHREILVFRDIEGVSA